MRLSGVRATPDVCRISLRYQWLRPLQGCKEGRFQGPRDLCGCMRLFAIRSRRFRRSIIVRRFRSKLARSAPVRPATRNSVSPVMIRSSIAGQTTSRRHCEEADAQADVAFACRVGSFLLGKGRPVDNVHARSVSIRWRCCRRSTSVRQRQPSAFFWSRYGGRRPASSSVKE